MPPSTGSSSDGVVIAVGVGVEVGVGVGVEVGVGVDVGVGVEVGVGVLVLFSGALKIDALPCASMLIAVRFSAGKATEKVKAKVPSAAAVVRPRKKRPCAPLSAKSSTVTSGLAWPVTVWLSRLSNFGATGFMFAPLLRKMPAGRLS